MAIESAHLAVGEQARKAKCRGWIPACGSQEAPVVCGPLILNKMVLMRGLASVLGWTLLACAQASAQTPPAPEPWTAVRADAIRAHVEFLAADLLEGRASAARGH